MTTTSMQFGQSTIDVVLNEGQQPAKLTTDANGSTAGIIDGAGAVHRMMGTEILTIGAGGRFSTLADAIEQRNTLYPHTLIKDTTVTVTGTSAGSVSVDKFTLASGITYSDSTTLYGIRIGGSGNPIVPCRFFSATVGYAEYPFMTDYAGEQAEIFELVYSNIVLLPGTKLTYSENINHILPGFTTISALIPGTAELLKTSGATANKLLTANHESNKCRITGLRLTDSYRKINSIFMELLTGGQMALADIQIDNCVLTSASNDLIWCTNAGGIGIEVFNNVVRGTYDMFRFGTHRKAIVRNNQIEIIANVYSDGLNASGVVFGSAQASSFTYHTQQHVVKDNVMRIFCQGIPADTYNSGTAAGVEIRQGAHANSTFTIDGNIVDAEVQNNSATAGWDVAYSATALYVAAAVTAGDVTFIDNKVRSRLTGSSLTNVPVATIANSASASCVINRAGNSVFGGGTTAMGTNTAVLTTY